MEREPISDTYLRECFEGKRLYGDDFDEAKVREWFEYERRAYFELSDDRKPGDYPYHSLNESTMFRYLTDMHFEVALGLGCAFGDDIAPLASQVDRYIAIEPCVAFWQPTIGGKEATYMAPSHSGAITLPNASVDLVAAISTFQHVPQVSIIVAELARALKPGGMFVSRDTSISMGDWRVPRSGLSPNQRGIPRAWFETLLNKNGLDLVAVTQCCFGPVGFLWRKYPAMRPYSRPWLVELDKLVCAMTAANARYHRTTFWQRLSPQQTAYVARKR